jgi:hypothetical protein
MDDDDVEFVEARSRAGARMRSVADRRPTPAVHFGSNRASPRSVTPYPPPGLRDVVDLTGDDDDVVLVNSRQRENVGANLGAPAGDYRTVGGVNELMRHAGRHLRRVFGVGDEEEPMAFRDRALPQQNEMDRIREARLRLEGTFIERERRRLMHTVEPMGNRHVPTMGINLDYHTPAFNWATGVANPPRPQTPKYSPPPEPADGFTRNPGEDEIVVCPNCGDELAVGDGDLKQEVWVVKTCGHVSQSSIHLHHCRGGIANMC